jgi:AAA15 family ATPase/GTPase
MQISQLSFQSNIAQSLIEDNDYKVENLNIKQNLNVEGYITGKSRDDI